MVKVIGASFQSVQMASLLLIWKHLLNTLSSSLLLNIRCFLPLFGNVLQAKESCVGVLQEFSVFPLTVCDVVPSLQALGLAHAAHLPPLGQIIPTPSSDFGCRSCQAVAIAN